LLPEFLMIQLKDAVKLHAQSFEKQILNQALESANGNKALAARELNLDYKTFHNKLGQTPASAPKVWRRRPPSYRRCFFAAA
jgi:DNA-binding NtrC family response regulator